MLKQIFFNSMGFTYCILNNELEQSGLFLRPLLKHSFISPVLQEDTCLKLYRYGVGEGFGEVVGGVVCMFFYIPFQLA